MNNANTEAIKGHSNGKQVTEEERAENLKAKLNAGLNDVGAIMAEICSYGLVPMFDGFEVDQLGKWRPKNVRLAKFF